MKFSISTLFFTFLALFSSLSLAAPIVEKRDVYTPRVLLPNADSVWKIGTQQTVTWDVSDPPKQITNKKGRIVLVKPDGLLDLDNPLASDFDILLGEITVTVPDVAPGLYQINLFGDSGNRGEKFPIVA